MPQALLLQQPCVRVHAASCVAARARGNAAPRRPGLLHRRSTHNPRCVTRLASSEDSGTPEPDDDAAAAPTDWRDFRARLVAAERALETPFASQSGSADRWAHALPALESGCLLLANPALFTESQPYFQRAAIFIFSHDSTGSQGVILNRATEKRIRDVPGGALNFPELQDNRLFLGGDVGRSTLHILHPDSLSDGKRIVDGVAMGAFAAARAAVSSGALKAESVKLFTRYCGWGSGQLEAELAQGVWFLAACSASIVLAEPPRSGPEGLWGEVLRLMGGEYAEMAEAEEDGRPGEA